MVVSIARHRLCLRPLKRTPSHGRGLKHCTYDVHLTALASRSVTSSCTHQSQPCNPLSRSAHSKHTKKFSPDKWVNWFLSVYFLSKHNLASETLAEMCLNLNSYLQCFSSYTNREIYDVCISIREKITSTMPHNTSYCCFMCFLAFLNVLDCGLQK